MAGNGGKQMSKEAVVTYGRRKRRSPSTDEAEDEVEEEKVQRRHSPSLTLTSPITHKCKQYFLDFGQLDFSYSTCKICGLLYARGHGDDEKLHALFHKRYIHGVLFKGWQKERVIVKHEKDDERIILVLQSDPLQHQLKVKELVKIMEKDLGIEPGWLIHDRCKVYLYVSLKKVVGCAVTEPISQAYPVLREKEPTATKKVSNGSSTSQNNIDVQPCCAINDLFSDRDDYGHGDMLEPSKSCYSSDDMSEPLESCHAPHLQQHDDVKRANKHSTKTRTMVFGGVKFQRERVRKLNVQHPVATSELPAVCTRQPVAVVCGIRGLWVSKSERRRGIATRLIDAVRTSFVYGLILDASQCAFSQPSSDGKAFAAKYNKTESYLVYT